MELEDRNITGNFELKMDEESNTMKEHVTNGTIEYKHGRSGELYRGKIIDFEPVDSCKPSFNAGQFEFDLFLRPFESTSHSIELEHRQNFNFFFFKTILERSYSQWKISQLSRIRTLTTNYEKVLRNSKKILKKLMK